MKQKYYLHHALKFAYQCHLFRLIDSKRNVIFKWPKREIIHIVTVEQNVLKTFMISFHEPYNLYTERDYYVTDLNVKMI